MIPKIPKDDSVNEIMLNSFKVYTETLLSRTSLLGYQHDIKIALDAVFNNLIFTLESRIWGEKLGGECIRHPLDWWEALKQRFAPEWFLNKYPIKWKTYQIDAKILYPNLKIQVPNEQHVVYIQVLEDPLYEYK